MERLKVKDSTPGQEYNTVWGRRVRSDGKDEKSGKYKLYSIELETTTLVDENYELLQAPKDREQAIGQLEKIINITKTENLKQKTRIAQLELKVEELERELRRREEAEQKVETPKSQSHSQPQPKPKVKPEPKPEPEPESKLEVKPEVESEKEEKGQTSSKEGYARMNLVKKLIAEGKPDQEIIDTVMKEFPNSKPGGIKLSITHFKKKK
jgi:hypothetical protein